MRRHILVVACITMLQGGCTSREDAENMLNIFVAMLNGGLVEDYDDYPGKSVEPDRRNRGAARQNDPNDPVSDGASVASAGGGTTGSAGASGASATGSPSDSPGLGSSD